MSAPVASSRDLGMPKRMPAQLDGLSVCFQADSPLSGFQIALLDFADVVGQGSRNRELLTLAARPTSMIISWDFAHGQVR